MDWYLLPHSAAAAMGGGDEPPHQRGDGGEMGGSQGRATGEGMEGETAEREAE